MAGLQESQELGAQRAAVCLRPKDPRRDASLRQRVLRDLQRAGRRHAGPCHAGRRRRLAGRSRARRARTSSTRLGSKHLVFASQAFSYTPKFRQELDATFTGTLADAVNVHPLPNTVLGGRAYMLGNFMSKELKLAELADFCRAARHYPKPCVLDEDNAATIYRDPIGWTIHRKRAWIAALSQAHYDFIDFSITVGSEAGTKESSAQIRTWMKHLSEFLHGFDFVHAAPLGDWIERKPEHVVAAALGVAGEHYVAYLADAREVTDPAAGRPIGGEISFRLPEGFYTSRASVSDQRRPLAAGESARRKRAGIARIARIPPGCRPGRRSRGMTWHGPGECLSPPAAGCPMT